MIDRDESDALPDPYLSEPAAAATGPVREARSIDARQRAAGAPKQPLSGSRRWRLVLYGALAVQLAVIVSLGLQLWSARPGPRPAQAPPSAMPPLAPTSPPGPMLDIERRTSETFRTAAPSVVYITTLAVQQDPFRRDALAVPRGTGSGFVWDTAGNVVTNFHVIAGANAARVTLEDGSVWPAKLVGEAADKDLAVLRIEAPADKLHPLAVGSSADLVVGQQVLAIGNPFGLDHTLSTGVISGLGREITAMTGRPIQGAIQTDAAINPGNSGGPLLDSSGRLIGVNTAIYSPSGASAGVGFAVPVDTVNRVVTQLISFGKLVRPGLGIQIAEAALARRVGVKGVLVIDVGAGSPAERAGLRPTTRDPATGAIILGDIIVALDGEPIAQPTDLYRQIDRKGVGEEVKLTVVRGRDRKEISVELAPLAE